MENIRIKKFLIFQDVDLEIKKITLIIGTQASGKSLLAKLIYFFRKFIDDIYLESIDRDQLKRQVEKEGLILFEQYFPRYAWGNNQFEIVYTIDDVEVSVRREKNSRGELRIKLDYSKRLADLHRRYKYDYRRFSVEYEAEQELLLKKQKNRRRTSFLTRNPWREFRSAHLEDFVGKYAVSSVFIPASTTYFANFQKNVFSFLASNIEIDPFIKEFGSFYENSKRLYDIRSIILDAGDSDEETEAQELQKEIDGLVQLILAGKYVFSEDQDWIENNEKRINLSNASSGQQEALPMLLMLSTLPLALEQRRSFLIEEPEAHLFPKAQEHIISLLSLLYEYEQEVLITTHSPYILTAINNLILAGDVAAEGENFAAAVKDVLVAGCPIQYDDVGAYMMSQGSLISIKDDENRLIGVSLIDEVSGEFEQLFNALLDIGDGVEDA